MPSELRERSEGGASITVLLLLIFQVTQPLGSKLCKELGSSQGGAKIAWNRAGALSSSSKRNFQNSACIFFPYAELPKSLVTLLHQGGQVRYLIEMGIEIFILQSRTENENEKSELNRKRLIKLPKSANKGRKTARSQKQLIASPHSRESKFRVPLSKKKVNVNQVNFRFCEKKHHQNRIQTPLSYLHFYVFKFVCLLEGRTSV